MPSSTKNWPMVKTLYLYFQCKQHKNDLHCGLFQCTSWFSELPYKYHILPHCLFPILPWLGPFYFNCLSRFKLFPHNHLLIFHIRFHLYLCSLFFSGYHFIFPFDLLFLGWFDLLFVSSFNYSFGVYFPIVATIDIACNYSENCDRACKFSISIFSIQLLIPSFIWLDSSKYLKECLIKHNYITRL